MRITKNLSRVSKVFYVSCLNNNSLDSLLSSLSRTLPSSSLRQ